MDFRLTIAVAVYNRADIVGRTLDSIAAQTYRPLKVVLVDNNSTDGSYDVLCAWRRRVLAPDFQVEVLRETRQGVSFARNAAMKAVDTEWVYFFDSDDIIQPSLAECAMAAADACPDADIIGWNQRQVSTDGVRIIHDTFYPRHVWFHTVVNGNMTCGRYLVRTGLLRAVGGWDTSFPIMEDLELGCRLLARGAVARKVATREPLFDVVLTDNSLSRSLPEVYIKRSLPLWRKVADYLPENARFWADFSKVYVWACKGRCDMASLNLEDRDWTEGSRLWRLTLKLMYGYTVRGGRGAMRLFLIFSKKSMLG